VGDNRSGEALLVPGGEGIAFFAAREKHECLIVSYC
jgi:hypothetical protein